MPIICPECGGESLDLAFCDLCNADLTPPAAGPVPETCPLLPAGERLTGRQRKRLARPESAVVLTTEDEHVWRIHWLGRAEFPRWFPLIEERERRAVGILPPCQQIDDPQGLWLAFPCRGWPTQPWWTKRADDVVEELRRLYQFAQVLAETLTELHENQLVWLNFNPAELEEIPVHPAADATVAMTGQGSSFRLSPTNLDLQIFPAGYFPQRLIANPAFAAPEVAQTLAEQIGPATDVFHLAMFCYCWLARLLPDGFPGRGLQAFSYQVPALRIFMHDLPPGLEEVLRRGLAEDPHRRPASPAEFMAELGQALRAIEARWTTGPKTLAWEIGAHTRTGRSKTALNMNNEDAVLVKEFTEPPRLRVGLTDELSATRKRGTFTEPRRAFLAVADGISICDVGTGALASSMTLATLEKHFTDKCRLVDFDRMIVDASRQASKAMIDWAVAEGHEQALRDEQNLMGTTLCAAWLQDNLLSLANLGDSRAYLVTAAGIEQLTVDGDMNSALLAEGTPPEEVRQLGSMGKALRDCVGGCQVTQGGELVPWTDAPPTLGRFPLLPGDVVILCSDGLVEEGAFLHPNAVFKLIREHRQMSAADLAELLANEADALQRLPSSLELEGFGDNISCIVVKVG